MHNVMTKPCLVSPCRRIPHSEDFQILDCSYFEKTGSAIPLCNNDCCVTCMPDKQNFFYMFSFYSDGTPMKTEYGIGEIYSYARNKKALKREFAIKTSDRRGTQDIRDHKPIELNPKAEYFVVHSYVPDNLRESLAIPNSVLCSVERFDPTPVELEDNSVLGRLNDKIQSIDGAELRTILTDDRIVDAVKKSKKPLILATNKLELKNRLICGHIHVRPGSRPSKPQPGLLHYNDGLDCLEIFTSQGWRSVTTTPTG